MNDVNAPGGSRRDRIAGALLGVHAGDALGAAVEFSRHDEIRERFPGGVREIVGGGPFGWPAGHATDDTDLTRAVLLAYLDPGADVVRTAADRMLDWLTGNWPDREPGSRPRDIGGATELGLTRFQRSGDPRTAGAGAGQAGNGSLMRCVSTALAVPDRARRVRESAEISAITHDDPRCTVSCAVYNEIVAALLNGAPPAVAVAFGEAISREFWQADVTAAITRGFGLELATAALIGQAGLPDDGGGFVLDSLSLAVAAVLDPRGIADVLADVILLGSDTDTNAAIAGGLVGARDGAAAIPAGWLEVLQFGAEFAAAADVLCLG